MKLIIATFGALAALVCSSAAIAQSTTPLRTVSGNVVQSPSDPTRRIEIVPPATYVGAVRFVLFGAADCEIHLFVDADASKRVRRLYWVQFEGYLPKFPDFRYEVHPAYTPVRMSGLPFHQRARFGQSTDAPKAGSDADRALTLLKEKGYTFPAETVNVTYKHFFDHMRKELMLTVIEDMTLSGTTFAQLEKDGAVVQSAWAPIAEQLIARASKAFAVSVSSSPGK
jgi:hypothetical protein